MWLSEPSRLSSSQPLHSSSHLHPHPPFRIYDHHNIHLTPPSSSPSSPRKGRRTGPCAHACVRLCVGGFYIWPTHGTPPTPPKLRIPISHPRNSFPLLSISPNSPMGLSCEGLRKPVFGNSGLMRFTKLPVWVWGRDRGWDLWVFGPVFLPRPSLARWLLCCFFACLGGLVTVVFVGFA